MARDVSDVREKFGSIPIALGLRMEQLILILYVVFLIPTIYLLTSDIRRRRAAVRAPVGCTRLGLKGESHMIDEYDRKYDNGSSDQNSWRIKAIYIHPVKSCAPVELEVADVEKYGLAYDRQFAFAEYLEPTTGQDKTPVWTFRTLRQPGYEKLALIRPEVWIPTVQTSRDITTSRQVEREGALIVRYPNVPTGFLAPLDKLMISWGLLPSENSFKVPLNPGQNHDYKHERVNIWKDYPAWLNMGKHVPNDFKQWLGVDRPFALFRVDHDKLRQVYRCAPQKEEVGYQPVVGFQDAYPLNLLNIASVHDVGNQIKDSIPRFSARRFRTNFILEGMPKYNEDDWKRIKIGGHQIRCACHTVRCRLPNVDPDTSERHREQPDKVLKSFRCIDAGDPKNACLGLQLVPESDETFQIRVGDRVEVVERGEHFYIKQ